MGIDPPGSYTTLRGELAGRAVIGVSQNPLLRLRGIEAGVQRLCGGDKAGEPGCHTALATYQQQLTMFERMSRALCYGYLIEGRHGEEGGSAAMACAPSQWDPGALAGFNAIAPGYAYKLELRPE